MNCTIQMVALSLHKVVFRGFKQKALVCKCGGEFNHWKRNSTRKILVIWSRPLPTQSGNFNTELLLKQSTLNQINYKDTCVIPRKHFQLCWQPKMLSIFQRQFQCHGKMLLLKWKKARYSTTYAVWSQLWNNFNIYTLKKKKKLDENAPNI